MSQSRPHGSPCADVKLFTALEWLPRSSSSTYLLNNIYCPPTVFQTETQVLGRGGEKTLIQSQGPMPGTLLTAQQAFTRCGCLSTLEDLLSI